MSTTIRPVAVGERRAYVRTDLVDPLLWRARLDDWQPGAPVGWGPSRERAIADLRRQIGAEQAREDGALRLWAMLGLIVAGAVCVPLLLAGVWWGLWLLSGGPL